MNDLPPGWAWAKVRELADANPGSLVDGPFGSNLKTEHYVSEPGPRVIRLQNIGDGFFRGEDQAFITRKHFESLGRHDARPGDVLIAALGEILPRACLVPEAFGPAIVKADCFRLRPAHGVNARLIQHLLNSPQIREAASQLISGVGRPRLNLGKVGDISIPLAPAPEQERIVAAIEEQFSRLDAGVAALDRVRQDLKRLRNIAFTGLADSVSDWTTLGAIADVVGGITKDAKRQSDPSFVEVPYLRVANVQRGYLNLDVVTTIRVPMDKARKLRLEPGDVLFNEGGDRDKLGRGWIWQGQIVDCIHQNHVFRARLAGESFEPKFVSMHGNTFGREWFEQMGKQTTNLASLSLKTLKSFPVPVLSIAEQRFRVAEIERRASLIEALDVAVKDALRRSEQLHSAILFAAFSGTLVSQDPSDEPASALLERIAAERVSSNGRQPARKAIRMKVTA